MGFSESIKLDVKRKAAFRCCRCQELGPQVHHIIPTEFGGGDEVDNAAPLCPNCHDFFGPNPNKRKEIRQMRDWWYEQVEKMYPGEGILEKLEKIDAKLEGIRDGLSSVDELKQSLMEYAGKYIGEITADTASAAATDIVDALALDVGCPQSEFRRFICGRCGAEVMGAGNCPNCGARIRLVYR